MLMGVLHISDLRGDEIPKRARRHSTQPREGAITRSYATPFNPPFEAALTSRTATGEPEGVLWRADKGYGPGAAGTNRINATLLALVRNQEVKGMVQAMQDLERTWNHKFNYPWTFFNDVPFSDEFKRLTQAETKAECRYGRSTPELNSWRC